MDKLFKSGIQIIIKLDDEDCEYRGKGYVTKLDVRHNPIEVTTNSGLREFISGHTKFEMNLILDSFHSTGEHFKSGVLLKHLHKRLKRRIDG